MSTGKTQVRDTDTLLSVRDVSVSYLTQGGDQGGAQHGEMLAVKSVSFDLARGETLGLVGESGSGKSTLIGALLRTLGPPSLIKSGEAELLGVDLLTADEEAIQALRWVSLSLVPQSAMNALNPVMTIRAQLEDTLRSRWGRSAKPARLQARCEELMSLVGIDSMRLDSYPHQLSGGMRQRVTIALALAFEPVLIVMDEPTTALDVIVQAELLEMISELRDRLGFSILMITHDLPLMLAFADRVGVMRGGELVELGVPQQLLDSPAHPYTRQLIDASTHSQLERARDLYDPTASSASTERGAPVMSAQALCVSYQVSAGWWRHEALRAVDGVSLDLYSGETLAVVGASGSGKSTLGRALCLLEDTCGGTLTLDGSPVDPHSPPEDFRSQVQMIFQDPFGSLNPVHTVAHHIIRPLKLHHQLSDEEAHHKAIELLESVGLTPAADFIERYPHQLSGGQRQRVAVARGLAPEPKVIIADEPTSMLDVSIRGELLTLLRSLVRARGVSLLLITHDLDTARALADRIMVLRAGRVVEEGEAEEVLTRPRAEYTRALWAAQPSSLHVRTHTSKNHETYEADQRDQERTSP